MYLGIEVRSCTYLSISRQGDARDQHCSRRLLLRGQSIITGEYLRIFVVVGTFSSPCLAYRCDYKTHWRCGSETNEKPNTSVLLPLAFLPSQQKVRCLSCYDLLLLIKCDCPRPVFEWNHLRPVVPVP